MLRSEIESNENLVHVIPYDSGFILPFEKWTFGYEQTIADWCNARIHVPVLIAAVYGVCIFLGRRFMRSRPAFEVRGLLIVWNVLLAVFSAIATVRILPNLVYLVSKYGYTTSVCHSYGYSNVTGFWAILFIMSKPLELGDTLFIVLRKQPLQFLHWYHHMTVMVYSWWTWSFQMGAARWFYTDNYAVHALMYSYFALRAAKFRLPRAFPMLVTSLQLLQMIMGMVAILVAWVRFEQGHYCRITRASAAWGIVMYISYFALFLHLFYNNYLASGASKASSSSSAHRVHHSHHNFHHGSSHPAQFMAGDSSNTNILNGSPRHDKSA